MRKRKKSCNWIIITILILLLCISVGYSALSSMLSMSGEVTVMPEKRYPINYAVQIYGINEDVDADGNPLELTFGPATGDNYNNKYVTHEYEETSPGSGEYYVKIITHTVASNGTETTSPEYLYKNGGTTEYVTRTETQKNKYDVNLHEMTWEEIANVPDKTVFWDCLLCGDTKKVELSLNSTIATGNKYNQYGDGTGSIATTIKNMYRKWNPRPSDNAAVGTGVTLDSNEETYGSNARNAGGYAVSHLRATLIGANDRTVIGYAGDDNLTASNCLYSCLPSDLKSVIVAKKIRYVTGTSATSYTLNDDIADKIWAFSEREVYGTGQYSGNTTEGLGADGHGYPKFGSPESKYYLPSYDTESTTQRTCYYEYNNWTYYWWLRSVYLRGTYIANDVDNGHFGWRQVYGTDCVTFGFCIGVIVPSS